MCTEMLYLGPRERDENRWIGSTLTTRLKFMFSTPTRSTVKYCRRPSSTWTSINNYIQQLKLFSQRHYWATCPYYKQLYQELKQNTFHKGKTCSEITRAGRVSCSVFCSRAWSKRSNRELKSWLFGLIFAMCVCLVNWILQGTLGCAAPSLLIHFYILTGILNNMK